jgi:hypothetical protein
LRYALHVHGPDGRDFRLNHGVDRGATLVAAAAPSRPALVKLIQMFTHPASAGGPTITGHEISLAVEQLTWPGGPASRTTPSSCRPSPRSSAWSTPATTSRSTTRS